VPPEEELAWLKEQSNALQDQLNQINARITELASERGEE
jgi:ubiquinone biosynthesis protein UbiJ